MWRPEPVTKAMKECGSKAHAAAKRMIENGHAQEKTGHRLSDDILRRLEGRRVLIVEDDRATRDLLRIRLEAIGYDVLEADNGMTAVQKIADNDIGLIITDLNMPGYDGARIASLIEKPGFPILILTGHPQDERLVDINERCEGEVQVMGKPFEFDAVASYVEENLGMPE